MTQLDRLDRETRRKSKTNIAQEVETDCRLQKYVSIIVYHQSDTINTLTQEFAFLSDFNTYICSVRCYSLIFRFTHNNALSGARAL